MAPLDTVRKPQLQLKDPLALLPCSTIVEYRRGQTIFSPDQPSTSIYLVMDGRVKLSRITDDGHQVLIDIYQRDEFFGESALLTFQRCAEHAAALENTRLMTWRPSQIEEIIMCRPRLGILLSQVFVQRIVDFTSRIQSFSADKVHRRLIRLLIGFSERFGTPEENGSVEMMPLTHQLLAEYVGTSREIVTHYMNRFRREGYLQYSRKRIILRPEALREWERPRASSAV